MSDSKVGILIPCFNEEAGIGQVLDDIPHARLAQAGYQTETIVIDNNSTDATSEVACARGARVVFESRRGKGRAVLTGFRALSPDTTHVVMLDGDNTYKPREIPRLLEPLSSDFCDVIVGSRLAGKVARHAFRRKNQLANSGYTFLVRRFYRAMVTDVLTGYFAWRREVVDALRPHLTAGGFGIEMEMITKMARLGFRVYSVPITYDQRAGQSKLNTFRDGAAIMAVLLKNLGWAPDPECLCTAEEEALHRVNASALVRNA
ncbi:MAG: glycosyltransferase family 2 protein [Chloroflexota bacterium]